MRLVKFFNVTWLLLLVAGLYLMRPLPIQAGIYHYNTDTIYKEIWIDHKEFTGGCADLERPNGTWYIEAGNFNSTCQKILDFQLPADFAKATKIEVYLDIWRGHTPPSVGFLFNNGPKHLATVGAEWSRTPLVQTIDSSEFLPGANTMKIWNENSAYHLHDIAFRLYYNADDPLAGQTPPTAELLSIQADNGAFAPGDGGVLNIDNDKITLTAGNVSANAKYIEFHAFYEGYDEDNDGLTHDWHNRSRNNCHPGGLSSTCEVQVGNTVINPAPSGTTDHVATVTVNGSATYAVDWNVPHIAGQTGVKFKIRVIDSNRNIRDAAGGASASFTLNRTKAVTTFSIPNFEDDILYAEGTRPLTTTRYIELPPDVQSYDQAYIIGSYWKNPYIKINQLTRFRAFSSSEDEWALSMRSFSVAGLTPGQNTIVYEYSGGYGQFIEKPGPMLVLRRTKAPGADTTPPWLHHLSPAAGAIYINPSQAIEFYLHDSNSGVDANSIILKVNGTVVSPELSGDQFNYKLRYQPPTPFAGGSTVTVQIEARDKAQNVMPPENYSFSIRPDVQPAGLISDDFNACVLNTNTWTFVNPRNDTTLQITGEKAVLTVPGGTRHDIWSGRKDAPRLVQNIVNGNFDLIVKFDSIFSLTQGSQAQGLIVGNSDNFIRFDTQFDGTNLLVFLRNFENGNVVTSNGAQKTLAGQSVPPAYLRIVRTDPKWKFSYSSNGKNWTTLTEFDRILTVSEVSVFAGNGGNNPPHTVIIDYVFNAQSPIDPEDGKSVELPVNIVGQGTVTKEPTCGNPVTLTATAALGWSFSKYAGAINSTQNPVNFTFPKNSQVTATFTLNYYALNVKVVDEQGVPITGNLVTVKAPTDPKGYVYGEEATLTAIPNPAWKFLQWRGPVNTATPTVTLSMQGNQVITATFGVQHYPLDLRVVDTQQQPLTSGGAVQVAPTTGPTGYPFGVTIALTATTEPGWTFQGWSGALSGANPRQSLTVDAAKVVTATFQQEHYPLTLLVVDQNGQPITTGGVVTMTHPADGVGYVYGETATLHAVASPGWLFLGWGGDLTGTESNQVLTFTEPRTVVATFQQEYYVVALTLLDEQGATVDAAQVLISPPASARGYVHGEQATITLTPNPGWIFVRWEGALAGDANPATVTIDGNKEIRAIFAKDKYKLSVAYNPATAGAVTVAPTGLYTHGQQVSLTVVPTAGWQFTGWSGDLAGTANPATLIMDGNKVVTATFTRIEYHLNVAVGGQAEGGSIQIEPHKSVYFYGEEVTARALANTGWQFTGWTITPDKPAGIDLLQSTIKVKITDTFTFIANFSLIPVTLNQVFIPLVAKE